MSQPNFEYMAQIISALVDQLDGDITLSNEEIEDAPMVEVSQLFEMDQIRLRTVVRKDGEERLYEEKWV